MFGFKRWAENRKKEREDDARRDGYDFAAGRLLRGASTVESLRDEADAMMWGGPFDRGVTQATKDWVRLVQGKESGGSSDVF